MKIVLLEWMIITVIIYLLFAGAVFMFDWNLTGLNPENWSAATRLMAYAIWLMVSVFAWVKK